MLKKCLLMSAVLMMAGAPIATEGDNDMAVKLFGKEDATKRVTDGALFIDGLFVKAPYSVTREGNVILVNGRIAARFKVASADDSLGSSEKAKADAATAKKDHSGAGEDHVSDKAGATISDDMPDIPAPKASANKTPVDKTSAIEKRLAKKKGGGSIEERLKAKKKGKELKDASSKGSFNQEATSQGDPMALFEEADYTYTPPSKPEPKAVPYIRPAAQKSMGQRMAEAKKKDAEVAKKQTAPAKEEPAGGDEIATEDFDNLTDAEIAAYTEKFKKFRALIEKSLGEDRLVLMSSTGSGVKAEKKTTMRKFMTSLESLCGAADAKKLQAQWGKTLPRGYLQKIYDNREANLPELKTILSRIAREQKEEKARADKRLR